MRGTRPRRHSVKARSRKRRAVQRHVDELAGLYGIVRQCEARMRENLYFFHHQVTLATFAPDDYAPQAL